MTILSPEIIEKAARALQVKEWDDSCARPSFDDDHPDYWKASARAALEAALPEILEMAAKELAAVARKHWEAQEDLEADCYHDSANRIRSLQTKDGA